MRYIILCLLVLEIKVMSDHVRSYSMIDSNIKFCLPGYYLSSEVECLKAEKEIQNCEIMMDSKNCLVCKPGMYFTGNECAPVASSDIIYDCNRYLPKETNKCLSCINGKRPSYDMEFCFPLKKGEFEDCNEVLADQNWNFKCMTCKDKDKVPNEKNQCVKTELKYCEEVHQDWCVRCDREHRMYNHLMCEPIDEKDITGQNKEIIIVLVIIAVITLGGVGYVAYPKFMNK